MAEYSTIYNTMYRIIMSSDVRNGRIFSVRMSHQHREDFIGIYLRVKTGHRIHTRFTITRPHTGWWRQNIISGDRGVHYIPSYTSVNPHTFLHKAPRYIQHNGMLKYSTVHRMRCNVEQYCMVQHISHNSTHGLPKTRYGLEKSDQNTYYYSAMEFHQDINSEL